MVAKGDIDYSHIGLAYSVGLSEELRDDMEVYAHDLGFKDVTWTQVGGVISSHCGPTAFGAVLTLKAQGLASIDFYCFGGERVVTTFPPLLRGVK